MGLLLSEQPLNVTHHVHVGRHCIPGGESTPRQRISGTGTRMHIHTSNSMQQTRGRNISGTYFISASTALLIRLLYVLRSLLYLRRARSVSTPVATTHSIVPSIVPNFISRSFPRGDTPQLVSSGWWIAQPRRLAAVALLHARHQVLQRHRRAQVLDAHALAAAAASQYFLTRTDVA
eukprot:COSAG01_NODE_10634_length_2116_cov_2.040654_3_plen_177_part_00